jgi:hypothetical protein
MSVQNRLMRTVFRPTVAMIVAAAAAVWSPLVRCEEAISELSDGRYRVQMKDAIVALTEEDPTDRQTGFSVSTPPGTSPVHFYLTDLVRDPERYASRLRSSEWNSVSVGLTRRHPGEIVGVPVVKGVNGVGIHTGVDRNCEAWLPNWARYRDAAIGLPADQYGWTRQDNLRSPRTSMFIKFLDERDRSKSRYYPLQCDFSGTCSLRACHNGLTAWVSIYSSNKLQGEDYAVKSFDQQIVTASRSLTACL